MDKPAGAMQLWAMAHNTIPGRVCPCRNQQGPSKSPNAAAAPSLALASPAALAVGERGEREGPGLMIGAGIANIDFVIPSVVPPSGRGCGRTSAEDGKGPAEQEKKKKKSVKTKGGGGK